MGPDGTSTSSAARCGSRSGDGEDSTCGFGTKDGTAADDADDADGSMYEVDRISRSPTAGRDDDRGMYRGCGDYDRGREGADIDGLGDADWVGGSSPVASEGHSKVEDDANTNDVVSSTGRHRDTLTKSMIQTPAAIEKGACSSIAQEPVQSNQANKVAVLEPACEPEPEDMADL